MGCEWAKTTLAQAGVTLIDCDHRTPPASEAGYPYIAIPQLKDGRIELSGVRRISATHYADWTKKLKPQGHDVIVVRRCNSGDSAVVPDSIECAIGQNLVVLRADGTKVLPAYLRWLLRGPDWWNEVGKYINVGAVFDSLKCRDIPNFEVAIPPIDAQREIASFLGALDDRIDLLRQTNATLEAIAQALFKSWFIDFDPVRAKAEGRAPEAMDAATAALFPSEFEESELGPIPKGWEVATLSEHVDAVRGLSYKGAGLTCAGDGLPMHNLNSVLEGGGYKYAGIKYYNGAYKERHLVEAGDIIVANTEQGHHHRLIGFPAIVPHRFANGIFSHHLYRVRAKKGSPITRHWLYYCLMTSAVRDQIIGCSNGSTVNMLKPAGLQIPQMVVPPAKLCQAFDAIAEDLRTKIESGVDRAETLAQLRDTLLPRLISGKLRLPEATEAVEAALA